MSPLRKKRRLRRKKMRALRRTKPLQAPKHEGGRGAKKQPTHPQATAGARGRNRFRKPIRITGTRFTGRRKRNDNQPRPTNGILFAITVMDKTLVSSGRLAM